MSFRGGRGGARFGGRGGAPLTEEERKAGSYQFPTTTYPDIAVPLQTRGNRAERLCAGYFLQFKTQVQEGPFFMSQISQATLDKFDKQQKEEQKEGGNEDTENGKKKKDTKKRKLNIDIEFDEDDGMTLNDGIKRYTDKYHKKRTLGKNRKAIDEHPYVIELFPSELYEAMGVVTKKNGTAGMKSLAARKLALSKFTSQLLMTEQQLELNLDDLDDAELERKKLQEKIAELSAQVASGETGADDDANDDNDDDDQEEENDEEYDEEDDDDYNAEKYFDDGDGIEDDDDNDEAAY